MALLTVEHLTKRYQNGRGAFDISFTIQQGDVFGLLGANGAGKTTVMKMLTGLCRPTSGSVHISGYNLLEQREQALAGVGAIIEAPAFYPYLTAQKNLQLALGYYQQCDKEQEKIIIDEILEKVGLLPYKNEKTSRYSLGMKQRMGLALSMIGDPKLYILDEPSNGLDIEGRVDVRNIILALSRAGESSFLISSHLSEEIEKTCNVVGIMKEGVLCSVAKMDTILSEYPNLETYYLQQISHKTEVVA